MAAISRAAGLKRRRRYEAEEEFLDDEEVRRQALRRAGEPIFHEREVGPGDDEYNDPRYISLDIDRCVRLMRIYEQDIDVQTFARASLNHALSGGILFTRKNRKLDEESSDWHNLTWGQWVREVEKMQFCLGFCIASSVPHPKFGARPVVLSLEHVEIKYMLDAYNTPHFRVFEKLDALDMIMPQREAQVFSRQRLLNVRCWAQSAPLRDGSIRSQLTTLIGDLMYENHLMQVAFVADRARARPPIVSQFVDRPYRVSDRVSVSATSDNRNVSQWLGSGTGPHIGPGPAVSGSDGGFSSAASVVNLMNSYSSADMGAIASRLGNVLRSNIVNGTAEQIYLEDGRQLVQQVMPEPPHAILLGFRQSRAVRVALAFGMTLPALTQPPQGVSANEVKKGGSHGKDDDGSNSVYFENFQRELKQRLVVYIHQMYAFIHTGPMALELVREALAKGDKPLSAKELQEDVTVSVALPGQPNEQALNRLYLEGVLRYDAYVNYISCKHSIPMDAFETKPKMDLKELNGVKEETEPAVGKKKK